MGLGDKSARGAPSRQVSVKIGYGGGDGGGGGATAKHRFVVRLAARIVMRAQQQPQDPALSAVATGAQISVGSCSRAGAPWLEPGYLQDDPCAIQSGDGVGAHAYTSVEVARTQFCVLFLAHFLARPHTQLHPYRAVLRLSLAAAGGGPSTVRPLKAQQLARETRVMRAIVKKTRPTTTITTTTTTTTTTT